jgi:thioesterase domain-containing protein/acyl carrier protein
VAESAGAGRMVGEATGPGSNSQQFEWIATELTLPEQVVKAIHARSIGRRTRPELGEPPVAPRTEIEVELLEIWSELLRIEPVGIRDDYFALGGTSLLAVDLFARIEHRFGRKLPLTSLIEASTIERLSRLVGNTVNRDSLVLIRDGGGRPPLFLVHDGDGETMLYRNLALCLGADHAIYGLQPHSRPDAPMAHTRIGEMAAYYIDKMRSVQPQGPYLVGGMCAGGVIAFEIALQLQSQGEKVALVALIDAADVKAPLKTWRFATQRIHSFSSAMSQNRPTRLDRHILSVFTQALRRARNLSTYLVGHYLKEFRDDVRLRLLRYYLDRGRTLPRALEQIPVRTVYLFAERYYQPDVLFEGNLVLFRATRGEGADEPYVARYQDPLLGWARRSTRAIGVHDIPGGHSSMLQEPHVQILAANLQLSIDELLADESISPAYSAITGHWTQACRS